MLQHTERVEYANLLETSGSQSHVYTNLEPHIYENVSSGGRRPDESADVASVSAAGLSKHSLVLSFSFEDVAVPLPATASFPTPLPSVSAAVAAAPAPVRCTQQIAQSNVVPSVRLETVVRQAPTRYTLSLPQSPNPVRWRERYLRLHVNVNDVWTRLNRLLQLDYTFYALRTLCTQLLASNELYGCELTSCNSSYSAGARECSVLRAAGSTRALRAVARGRRAGGRERLEADARAPRRERQVCGACRAARRHCHQPLALRASRPQTRAGLLTSVQKLR